MRKFQDIQAHISTKAEELVTISEDQGVTKKVSRKRIWKRVCLFPKIKPIYMVPGQTRKEESPLRLKTPSKTPKLLIDDTGYDADDDTSVFHKRHIKSRACKFSRERCQEGRERSKNRVKNFKARPKQKAEEGWSKPKSRKQECKERWRRCRTAIRVQLKTWEEYWEWD
ncbi:hypothetical protein BGZ60DRAFT_550026 [Tricladium varicosporioides]|nr:hypothetical protein BGZ60DRAFT_550026 [Hymenoscyphus varicosporioides]